MAARPPRPPFREKTTDNEDQLARILNRNPALVGETKLPRATKALAYAKLLLAEDATPARKKQRDAAWEWRDGQYAEWRRKCKEFDDEARRAALEKPRAKRQRTRPESVREAEEEAEKDRKLREAFDKMQRDYDADPQGAISRFTEKIEEVSKEPASAAMRRYGMCACSTSHALVKALGFGVAMAAEDYWRAHPVSAPPEALDVPKLLREVFQRVPNLSGADSVSIIMMLRLDGVEVVPPRRRRRRRCGSVTGPSRAGAGTASGQWTMLASEACSYIEVELPPVINFDEAKVRRSYGEKYFNLNTPKGRKELDNKVTYWTSVSGKALAALSPERKIDSIVEARRAQHQAPIDQICKDAAPLFGALVECQMSAAKFCDVQTCVGVIGHGHAYATTDHCGLLDAELVDESIRVFEAAKAGGLIKNLQDFYCTTGSNTDLDRDVGVRFTESLISEDSPLPKTGARGRISLLNKRHLYARDLSSVKELVAGVVMDGGVKNVEDAENSSALGRLVVVLHRRGELYHFLIRRGHILLKNEFTPACAVKILQIAVPLLFLSYQQDTDLVPRLKKEALDGAGLVVGNTDNSGMIASFKSTVPKMVARGVSKGLIEYE